MTKFREGAARRSYLLGMRLKYLSRGLTNVPSLVREGTEKYVRTGLDMQKHRIVCFNEHTASTATERIGVSPKVVHTVRGPMVINYTERRWLSQEHVGEPRNLQYLVRIIIHVCHHDFKSAVCTDWRSSDSSSSTCPRARGRFLKHWKCPMPPNSPTHAQPLDAPDNRELPLLTSM